MEYIKVRGHDHLVRDPNSNCIINTNKSEYNEYLTRRNSKIEEQKKVETMEEDLSSLKSEINEIKSLLKELVNGN